MDALPLASALGWGFPTWNEEEEIALLLSFGIGSVQLFRNKEKPIRAGAVRERLERSGLKVNSLHAFFGPPYDPSEPDEDLRQQVVENYVAEADFCRELGGRLLVVHPGDPFIGEETRDPARFQALTRSAEQLAEIGERKEVMIALENLQPGQMGDDMAMLRRIVDRVESPWLGINYDCGHANLNGDPVAIMEQAGPRIVGTHIHDNDGRGDLHLVPGTSTIDMDALSRALARVGYRGEFTLELMETTESIRATCDSDCLARLRRWARLAGGAED